MQPKLKSSEKDYKPMNRRKLIDKIPFTMKVKGKIYYKCHYDIRNNCIIDTNFVKIFTVTKIIIPGFYFRPVDFENNDYKTTDSYCSFTELEINPIKRHGNFRKS